MFDEPSKDFPNGELHPFEENRKEFLTLYEIAMHLPDMELFCMELLEENGRYPDKAIVACEECGEIHLIVHFKPSGEIFKVERIDMDGPPLSAD